MKSLPRRGLLFGPPCRSNRIVIVSSTTCVCCAGYTGFLFGDEWSTKLHVSAPVAVWSVTAILGWWFHPCRWQRPLFSAIKCHQHMRPPTHLCDRSFAAGGPQVWVAQSSVSVTTGHQLRTIQRQLKHIGWCSGVVVGPVSTEMDDRVRVLFPVPDIYLGM